MSINEIILRIKLKFGLKIVLSFILITMFAFFYLVPQLHPVFPIIVLKPGWIDRMIPFVPNAVYLYESLYLLMPVAPWLMRSKEELYRYSSGLILMSFVGFCFFFFLPTSNPRPVDVLDTNILYRTLILLDSELNAFPSLHTAYALFHSACCHVIFCKGSWHKLVRWIFWIWALLIMLSTLLTKQHVFIDVLSGALLGIGSFIVCCQPNIISWRRGKQI